MRPRSRSNQHGAINLLLVTLIGTGVLGGTAIALNSIRGAQDQQLALHANTQASARAWDGVELLRYYFDGLDEAGLVALEACTNASPCALTITGVDNLSATIISSVENAHSTSQRRLVANVTGHGIDTNVTVQAVYEFIPSPAGGGGGGDDGGGTGPLVKINSDLNLTGSITVLGGTSANLVVDGNVSMSGSVTGINELCATGNLAVGSAINVTRLCSNANVTLTGAATAGLVEATGNVTLSGGAATNIGTILANGNVVLSGGSANAGAVRTQGNVSVTGGNAGVSGLVEAEGTVTWSSSRSASQIDANGNVQYSANGAATINSRGNVTLTGNGNVQNLNALGNIFLQSGYGLGVTGQLRGGSALTFNPSTRANSGQVRGTISPNPATLQPWEPPINVTSNPALVVEVPEVSVPDIRPVTVPEDTVDVYPLKNASNYVFEREAGTGKRMVTVRNVTGIDNGTYYLGDYPQSGYKDYLCTEVTVNGAGATCTEPATPYRTLCQGFSTNNGCFAWSSGNQRWEINGQTMAPGLAWFDGNLYLGNGRYINTFLSTGNISTGGSLRVTSPNFAGYTGTCTDNRSAHDVAAIDTRLSGLYPSNLCAGGLYVPSSLANVAFIAGGYSGGTYTGGGIALGSSNLVYGSIIAGGLLSTSGSTTVTGAIEIANMTNSGSPTNWSGSTIIDLRNLPDTFDPECLSNCPGGGDGTAPPGGIPWRVLWSRYL